MATLAEQLDALAQREQQTEKLANAIKEFVLQDRIFDMLRKALSNKFTANIPYQRFDNEGFINSAAVAAELETMNTPILLPR